jgi:hypothetical protein
MSAHDLALVLPSLVQQPACLALATHHAETSHEHLRDLLAADPQHGRRHALEPAGLQRVPPDLDACCATRLSHGRSTNAVIERYRR